MLVCLLVCPLLLCLLLFAPRARQEGGAPAIFFHKGSPTPAARSERVLVVIMAQLRATQLTWRPFKKYLLDPLDADLALCVGRPSKAEDLARMQLDPFFTNAKYIWLYQDPPENAPPEDFFFLSAVDFAARWENANTTAWRKMSEIIKLEVSSITLQLFFQWFLYRSVQTVYTNYDRFIVTRSDMMFDMAHPPMSVLDDRFLGSPKR